MSDVRTGGPGPCPECGGEGRTQIGPLSFLCPECGGEGRVGGEEHAGRESGQEYDPAVHGPLAPVGQHPAAAGFSCPHCLDRRRVVHLAGGRLIEQPCPRCRAA